MAYIYSLNDNCEDKDQLGNKGANLITMTRIGLPVPPGFVLSVGDAYRQYKKTGELTVEEIAKAVANLEKQFGKKLGQGLEVSVRSSASASMPGMMDTVLNISDMKTIITSIKQVFESWDSKRAIEYRRLNNIPDDLGTAAVIQAMVFGNRDAKSGTGVVFSRNPSTGDRGLFGEYLSEAQGEAVVSGTRTPVPVNALKTDMPKVYAELERITGVLEGYFHDMQDIEFTVESGKLYMLQTRSGKRSGYAAIKIAVDMVHEGLITREEALLRISVENLQSLLHKQIKSPQSYKPLARGLNAAPGAAVGKVVFDPDEAVAWTKSGIAVILVRLETSPDDIHGIATAVGVLTQKGGLTSHAAIVTRAMGKACVCGAEALNIDMKKEQFSVNDKVIKKGDVITIDGNMGNIYLGNLPLEAVGVVPEFTELMSWANGFKRLGIRANADTPEMVTRAVEFGAEGIGLCRTERMFNVPERLSVIRKFILAENEAEREAAIQVLQKVQKKDFMALFKALNGVPIIVRLLDMPLHEFLPPENETTDPKIRQRIGELKEVNPMLGHRGVRLVATHPELYRMQIEAIEQARAEVPADVSIMLPQIMAVEEVNLVKTLFKGKSVGIKLGIMVESVRACVTADQLAKAVEFFSFGTNDLTQAVMSLSREDAEKKFLFPYLKKHLLKQNPFEVVDIEGVGRLMEAAIFAGRRTKKNLEIGVCGEHGGDPTSIQFFHGIGVTYVSCSPFRVPVAKLVAAQAAIREKVAIRVELTGSKSLL